MDKVNENMKKFGYDDEVHAVSKFGEWEVTTEKPMSKEELKKTKVKLEEGMKDIFKGSKEFTYHGIKLKKK